MRWRRLAVWALVLVILLIGGAGLGTVWLLRSEAGLSWLVSLAEERLPEGVSLTGISGSLAGGLEIDRLAVDLEPDELELRGIELRVTLRALLERRVVVDRWSIDTLLYRRGEPEAPADAGASSPLPLPVTIELGRGRVGSATLAVGDQEIVAGPISFALDLEQEMLNLWEVELVYDTFTARSERAFLELAGEFPLSAGVEWSGRFDDIDLAGTGEIGGTLSRLEFDHRLSAPVEVDAGGEMRLGEAPHVDVLLEWSALAWPGLERVESTGGNLTLEGWIEDFEFRGEGDFVADGHAVRIATGGRMTPGQAELEVLSLESGYGQLNVQGSVDLEPLGFDLVATGRGLDPSFVAPDWPGGLSLTGVLRGRLEPEIELVLSDAVVGGPLRGEALAATGAVSVTGLGDPDSPTRGDWQFDGFTATWGESSAFLDGRFARTLDLGVRLGVGEIEAFVPSVAGSVVVDGRLSGTFDQPGFAGLVTGENLSTAGFSADTLNVTGEISGLRDARAELDFRAEGLVAGRPIADTIVGRVEGTTTSHRVEIDVDTVLGEGSALASGGIDDGRWMGQIDSLTIDQNLVGLWSLESPMAVTAGRTELVVQSGCIRQAAASLCVAAEVGTPNEGLELTLGGFELATLQPLLAEDVTLAGRYDADVRLTGPLARPTGTFELLGGPTEISIDEDEAPLVVPIERVAIEGRILEEQFELGGEVVGPRQTRVDVDARVTEIWTPEPQIAATIDGRWEDLGVVALLSPDIGEVAGTASFELGFDGSLQAPVISGEAHWVDGRVTVPRWGFTLADINLDATTPDGQSLEYELVGMAGGGRVELTGSTDIDPERLFPSQLSLVGENLLAVRVPDAVVLVSPNLRVTTALPRIDVAGVVAVPSASLRLEELPEQAVSTSADVVVHGGEAEPAAVRQPLDVNADLRVVLGDSVSFTGAGLDADLTGELGLRYASGEQAVTSGQVGIQGGYTGFGQTLELDRGRLLFTGPIDDPGLDVLAVRRIDSAAAATNVTVGVQLTGTVKRPTTRLYSEPAMSDGDVLSYLLFGRPLSDSREANSQTLQTAALSLGLTQALPQLQQFGQAIGLDELSVRASDANTGELMAGKQISPRIYMRYTYGLFNRVGGLLMRFQLSDRLSLEAATGDYHAMDLLYTVEKE